MSSIIVADFLRDAVKASGLTHEEVCARAHISRQTLHRLLKAEINQARLSTMVKVCNALKIDPLEILGLYFDNKNWEDVQNNPVN